MRLCAGARAGSFPHRMKIGPGHLPTYSKTFSISAAVNPRNVCPRTLPNFSVFKAYCADAAAYSAVGKD